MMEHLRMNGAYWGLTTLDTLDKLEMVDIKEVVSWVMKCQHDSGGFGGNVGHDPHVLYTLSAVQILPLFDKINMLDIDRVSICALILRYVVSRFSRSYFICMTVLSRFILIKTSIVINDMTIVTAVFCCVGALAITGSLHHVDKDLFGWWLCERQVKSGGLNGRPEKLPDVCYSWWVLDFLLA
ncbi:hypothetical protein LguiA_000849 [Lonicera macranthoides]